MKKFKKLNLYLVSAHLILLLLQILFWNFIIDDAFITFRYARNFVNYQQIVFNVNETPVEGYSNFLWVMWMTLGFIFRIDPILFSKVSGMVFCHFSVYILYKLAFLIKKDRKFGSIIPLLYVATPNIALWSIGGLETPLFSLLLLTSVYFFIKDITEWKRRHFKISPIIFALLSLTRHEGVIIFGLTSIFIIFLLISNKEISPFNKIVQVLWFNAIFLLIYAPYFIWRVFYYNSLLPHTFVAKQGLFNLNLIISRFAFYLPLVLLLLPIILLIGINFVRNSKFRFYNETNLYISSLILTLTIILLLIHSWMPGFRFTVPIIPLVYLLLPKSLSFLSFFGNRYRTERILLKNIKILTLVVIFFSNFLIIFSFYPLVYFYGIGMRECNITLGNWIKKNTPVNASLAIWDAGAIPYYAEVRTIDIFPESLQDLHVFNNPEDADYILNQNITFLILNDDYFSYIKSDIRFTNNYSLLFYAQLFYAEGILGFDYIYQVYLHELHSISNASIYELLDSSPRFYV